MLWSIHDRQLLGSTYKGGSNPSLSAKVLHYLTDLACELDAGVTSGPQSSPQRVAIRSVARCEWASRRSVWRKPALARPPKPTSTAFAERLKRAVGIEHFDAGASPRVDIEERLMAVARVCWRLRYDHAALSAGSARANPRRYSAALDAWLQAVKKARWSAFNSSIQGPI